MELSKPDPEVDLRGEVCPYTFLKAKLALEKMGAGEVLRVVVDGDTSARDVPRGLRGAGHLVLAEEALGGGTWAIVVRKGGAAGPALADRGEGQGRTP